VMSSAVPTVLGYLCSPIPQSTSLGRFPPLISLFLWLLFSLEILAHRYLQQLPPELTYLS
jgi:hypothetical protein